MLQTETEVAEALFTAFANGEHQVVRDLCSPALQARQNHGPAMDLDTLLRFSGAVQGVVRDFRYEEPVRSATPNGFVEEHVVRGTLPDGSPLELAVCVVAEFAGGKITRLREYFDSAAAAGLVNALS